MNTQGRAGTGGPGVRQMIINLPAHPLHLLMNDRSYLFVALSLRPVGLLGENRQWSL